MRAPLWSKTARPAPHGHMRIRRAQRTNGATCGTQILSLYTLRRRRGHYREIMVAGCAIERSAGGANGP
jgi:hypothetical protein